MSKSKASEVVGNKKKQQLYFIVEVCIKVGTPRGRSGLGAVVSVF